ITIRYLFIILLFSFKPPAPPQLYTLSLHDALPISASSTSPSPPGPASGAKKRRMRSNSPSSSAGIGRYISEARSVRPNLSRTPRSEEHTSELQSQSNLVCRLLLEKKNTTPLTLSTC